jgi:hypothetical protein
MQGEPCGPQVDRVVLVRRERLDRARTKGVIDRQVRRVVQTRVRVMPATGSVRITVRKPHAAQW